MICKHIIRSIPKLFIAMISKEGSQIHIKWFLNEILCCFKILNIFEKMHAQNFEYFYIYSDCNHKYKPS